MKRTPAFYDNMTAICLSVPSAYDLHPHLHLTRTRESKKDRPLSFLFSRLIKISWHSDQNLVDPGARFRDESKVTRVREVAARG